MWKYEDLKGRSKWSCTAPNNVRAWVTSSHLENPGNWTGRCPALALQWNSTYPVAQIPPEEILPIFKGVIRARLREIEEGLL